MSAIQREELRTAAQGLILTDAQKHILAHRLARKLGKKEPGAITVSELLGWIDTAMSDLQPGVDMMVISEDAYRGNQFVGRV